MPAAVADRRRGRHAPRLLGRAAVPQAARDGAAAGGRHPAERAGPALCARRFGHDRSPLRRASRDPELQARRGRRAQGQLEERWVAAPEPGPAPARRRAAGSGDDPARRRGAARAELHPPAARGPWIPTGAADHGDGRPAAVALPGTAHRLAVLHAGDPRNSGDTRSRSGRAFERRAAERRQYRTAGPRRRRQRPRHAGGAGRLADGQPGLLQGDGHPDSPRTHVQRRGSPRRAGRHHPERRPGEPLLAHRGSGRPQRHHGEPF